MMIEDHATRDQLWLDQDGKCALIGHPLPQQRGVLLRREGRTVVAGVLGASLYDPPTLSLMLQTKGLPVLVSGLPDIWYEFGERPGHHYMATLVAVGYAELLSDTTPLDEAESWLERLWSVHLWRKNHSKNLPAGDTPNVWLRDQDGWKNPDWIAKLLCSPNLALERMPTQPLEPVVMGWWPKALDQFFGLQKHQRLSLFRHRQWDPKMLVECKEEVYSGASRHALVEALFADESSALDHLKAKFPVAVDLPPFRGASEDWEDQRETVCHFHRSASRKEEQNLWLESMNKAQTQGLPDAFREWCFPWLELFLAHGYPEPEAEAAALGVNLGWLEAAFGLRTSFPWLPFRGKRVTPNREWIEYCRTLWSQ
jgi:hypothetical protein